MERAGLSVVPAVLARDFDTLRNLVGPDTFLAGPDVAGSPTYAKAFCAAVRPNVVNAMTWHHYYGGGIGFPSVADLTSPAVLDSLHPRIERMLAATRLCGTNGSGPQPWIGETGNSFGG